MENKFFQIKNLKIALKDMEPYIKSGHYLITGRKFPDFSLLPREILGNLLICIIGNYNGYNLTFQEDSTNGDGIIFNKDTKSGAYTEHVIAINNVTKTKSIENSDDFITEKIYDKIKKGEKHNNKYKNKILIVFAEGMDNFHPLKIAKNINSKHNFSSIWIFTRGKSKDKKYNYIIIQLSTYLINPLIYKININNDFKSYNIEIKTP